MKSFKEFYPLTEGGNVQIGDVSAERIDLKKYNRDWIVERLFRTLRVINLSFQKDFGLALWNPELFKSKGFLSGSAFHFFDKTIATLQSRKRADAPMKEMIRSIIQRVKDKIADKILDDPNIIGKDMLGLILKG